MKTWFASVSLGLVLVASSLAEVPAPLAISLGAHRDTVTKATYAISASGAADQNRQEVQFRVMAADSTSAVTLRTGKQKTVGQVLTLAQTAFQKFLAGAAPNTVLGKLGNFEKGGEVVFVVASPEVLRWDFKSPDEGVVSNEFSRADAAAFVGLLGGK